jgi:hypothetical protein
MPETRDRRISFAQKLRDAAASAPATAGLRCTIDLIGKR